MNATGRNKWICLALSLCACLQITAHLSLLAQQRSLTIRNNYLSATYIPGSGLVEVRDLRSGIVFLKRGVAPDVTEAMPVSVSDPVFGSGRALRLSKPDGGYCTLALYPDLAFLFIQETIVNRNNGQKTIQKIQPFSFRIDLQKPAAELKTLGTGGLLPPADNPGSYVFLTTVDPGTRNGVVTGWLTNERGSGVVFSDTADNSVLIRSQIEYGHLRIPAGAVFHLETLMVGYFTDARIGEERFAEAIARHQHIRLPPRRAVYCTWYSEKYGGAGTSASTMELAKFVGARLKPFGLGVIQIDDQWQAGGQFNGPRRGFDRARPGGPYPNGMSEAANAVRAEGLTAGIWWTPFARNHQDPEYKERQSWFARKLDGSPFETKWGGTSLDCTNPQVQAHLRQMARTLHGWGFDYFKMDALWTGMASEQVYINDGYKDDHFENCAPLYDSGRTQIEAFRMGLRLLRDAVGKGVFFSGCCISQNMRSFGASIGLVDAMRVGPDYNHDGQSIRTGAIRASRLYFLNGRVWWNDPDPSIIRETGTSTADGGCKGSGSLTRSRLLPSWVALSGQLFLSSDWLPDLPGERLDIMKRCMASHAGTARPVDAFEKALPSIWLATDDHTGTSRKVLGLFNWDTTSRQIGCSADWAGLGTKTAYHAFDFWENRVLPDIDSQFSFDLPGESCKIIALRAKAGHPVLVSTSRHITQGMIDVKKETWSDSTLAGESELIAGDSYELRIAGLSDGGEWKVIGFEAIGKGSAVSIKMLPAPDSEKGWVRLVINGEKNDKVNWKVRFRKVKVSKSTFPK